MTKRTRAEAPVDRNFVCAGCTCLCDDIVLPDLSREAIVNGEDVIKLQVPNLCEKGRGWLNEFQTPASHFVKGQTVGLDLALQTASAMLESAGTPVICGLEGLCIESQQAAFRLADQCRAMIDTSLDHSGRGASYAFQREGTVTATLGEVAERSDLVVYWFCDPLTTHPRHLERYSHPEGKNREVIVVDEKITPTATIANEFIQLPRESATIVLSVMRSLIGQTRLNEAAVTKLTGQALSTWQPMAAKLLKAKYGAIFSGSSPESDLDCEAESLARLVRELNQLTRYVLLPMRADENALGAENVLAWSSGFVSSVNLQRGFPRNFGQAYSAESVLGRGECDLILLASTSSFSHAWTRMSDSIQRTFLRTPKIVLCESKSPFEFDAEVTISVARSGHTCGGDFCRQDDIPLRLTAVSDEGMKAAEVFKRLAQRES
jgi:formylmethanofuran dehydrogenase subunit B